MPLYEYECNACGCRFEVIQKFSDDPIDVCAQCGKGPVRKLLSSPAIQFKGSGWYITDYAQKGKNDAATSTGTKATEAKSDSSPGAGDSSSTKTETPATTKSTSGGTSSD